MIGELTFLKDWVEQKPKDNYTAVVTRQDTHINKIRRVLTKKKNPCECVFKFCKDLVKLIIKILV